MILDLKRAGHLRYSESTKKVFHQFKNQYKSEFSRESLESLKCYYQELSPLLSNINKASKNDQIHDMIKRLDVEVSRLISMQETNLKELQ